MVFYMYFYISAGLQSLPGQLSDLFSTVVSASLYVSFLSFIIEFFIF